MGGIMESLPVYTAGLIAKQHNRWAKNKEPEGADQVEFVLKSDYDKLMARITTAQTDVMYDVDGGLLSHNRDSMHNREVDVALVVIRK